MKAIVLSSLVLFCGLAVALQQVPTDPHLYLQPTDLGYTAQTKPLLKHRLSTLAFETHPRCDDPDRDVDPIIHINACRLITKHTPHQFECPGVAALFPTKNTSAQTGLSQQFKWLNPEHLKTTLHDVLFQVNRVAEVLIFIKMYAHLKVEQPIQLGVMKKTP